jgi:phage anti-repressor protein
LTPPKKLLNFKEQKKEKKTVFYYVIMDKRQFQYGFEENKDYIILLKFENNPIDYTLALKMRKNINASEN